MCCCQPHPPSLSQANAYSACYSAGVFCGIYVFIHLAGESVCKFVQYHGVVDIKSCMAHSLFELGDVSIQFFALHLESLAKHYLRLLLFEYVSVLPIEGSGSALP